MWGKIIILQKKRRSAYEFHNSNQMILTIKHYEKIDKKSFTRLVLENSLCHVLSKQP